jgi:hypothetical protein
VSESEMRVKKKVDRYYNFYLCFFFVVVDTEKKRKREGEKN